MGMYDEIRCEYPLPETGFRVLVGHTFQTKDLDNLLDKYTITTDGRLIHHREHYEEVPEKERPLYGTPGWDESLGKWVGSLRSVPEGDEEIPYHGDIHFYDAFGVRGEAGRVWLAYKARFTEGRLSRIEVADKRDLPPTKTQEIGGKEFPSVESGLGFDVVQLGEEAEIERDDK